MAARFAQRSVLVTGSTNGIGRATALAFAAEGAHVLVTGRDGERGQKVVAAIEEAGGRADFIAADMAAGEPEVTRLAQRATELAGGPIDVLVNNAAYLVGGAPTADTTDEVIDLALTVSVKAPFLLTKALAPAMAARGSGAIVNVGSINGLVGMKGSALYGATKSALHSLTKSWAAEFGPSGVRVNTVAPGPTTTECNEAIRDRLDQLVAGTPSGRTSTTAEVAAAILFLAGDDAANIHGATLAVDGGFTTH
jgi:NAD(P)-dependent dehydrogenase (short-subunit alcohol dehydrogenase family)